MEMSGRHQDDCHLYKVRQPERKILEPTRLDKACEIRPDEAAATRSPAN